MGSWLVLAGALLLAWGLAEAKTSRPDGTLVRVHPYRRLLAFVTPGRAQAAVTFDTFVDAEPLLAWLEEADATFGAHLTHAVVAACLTALAEVPRLNRFVVGRRLYQRDGEWITFSMKRRRLDPDAKLAMVKLCLEPGESFRALCGRIDALMGEQRSPTVTHEDREYGLFDALPRPVLSAAVRAAKALDDHNLLPGWFVKGDGLYTSMVIANLGSLGMGAAYHHLYEWGNCPVFLVVGATEEVPVARDGRVTVGRRLHLRWTFDERIDDGLNAKRALDVVVRVLSNPRRELGCLAPDGSDAVALDRGRPPTTQRR